MGVARFSGVPVGRFSGAAGAQAVSRASKTISGVRRFSMANFLQPWHKSEICATRPGEPSLPDKSDIDGQGVRVAWGFRRPHLRVSRSIGQCTDIPAPRRNNLDKLRYHILLDHKRH